MTRVVVVLSCYIVIGATALSADVLGSSLKTMDTWERGDLAHELVVSVSGTDNAPPIQPGPQWMYETLVDTTWVDSVLVANESNEPDFATFLPLFQEPGNGWCLRMDYGGGAWIACNNVADDFDIDSLSNATIEAITLTILELTFVFEPPSGAYPDGRTWATLSVRLDLIGPPTQTPIEATTWGGVKALYR